MVDFVDLLCSLLWPPCLCRRFTFWNCDWTDLRLTLIFKTFTWSKLALKHHDQRTVYSHFWLCYCRMYGHALSIQSPVPQWEQWKSSMLVVFICIALLHSSLKHKVISGNREEIGNISLFLFFLSFLSQYVKKIITLRTWGRPTEFAIKEKKHSWPNTFDWNVPR